jgi:hypothetical protein
MRIARRSVPDSSRDRRQNVALRELLDELIQLSRHLSNHAPTLPPGELAYARNRLEWLADEIWRHATANDGRSS